MPETETEDKKNVPMVDIDTSGPEVEVNLDEEKKVVYFRGDWPSVMGIPHYMKEYPGYTHRVLSWDDFEKLTDEQT